MSHCIRNLLKETSIRKQNFIPNFALISHLLINRRLFKINNRPLRFGFQKLTFDIFLDPPFHKKKNRPLALL